MAFLFITENFYLLVVLYEALKPITDFRSYLSKIQTFYLTSGMKFGIIVGQMLYHKVKIPSDEKFSNLDHSKRLWLSLKLVEI